MVVIRRATIVRQQEELKRCSCWLPKAAVPTKSHLERGG